MLESSLNDRDKVIAEFLALPEGVELDEALDGEHCGLIQVLVAELLDFDARLLMTYKG